MRFIILSVAFLISICISGYTGWWIGHRYAVMRSYEIGYEHGNEDKRREIEFLLTPNTTILLNGGIKVKVIKVEDDETPMDFN